MLVILFTVSGCCRHAPTGDKIILHSRVYQGKKVRRGGARAIAVKPLAINHAIRVHSIMTSSLEHHPPSRVDSGVVRVREPFRLHQYEARHELASPAHGKVVQARNSCSGIFYLAVPEYVCIPVCFWEPKRWWPFRELP